MLSVSPPEPVDYAEIVRSTLRIGVVRDSSNQPYVEIFYQTEWGCPPLYHGSDIIEVMAERMEGLLYEQMRNMGLHKSESLSLIETLQHRLRNNDDLREDFNIALQDVLQNNQTDPELMVRVRAENFVEHVKTVKNPEVKAVLEKIVPNLDRLVSSAWEAFQSGSF